MIDDAHRANKDPGKSAFTILQRSIQYWTTFPQPYICYNCLRTTRLLLVTLRLLAKPTKVIYHAVK